MQEIDGMNRAVASHEGCHVYGWLDVKRVAANFHISVHVEDYMLLAQVSLGADYMPSSGIHSLFQ